jgi:tRNA G18 (ribose-2'-O)-methylase SpoU
VSETRNIIDYYWYWETEAIKADLDTKRHQFAILCSNLYNDFNISTVIRNSNAFLAKKVYVYGRRSWDKRGSVGTHHYQHIEYLPEDYDLKELKKNYTFVAIDNVEGAVPMDDFVWPKNTLMLFGQEQVGLPPELIAECEHVVYIKQFGSVRSLNVGCASSIAMYDYCNKLGGQDDPED